MPNLFYEDSFDAIAVKCPNCGWEGKGEDTHIIDFYGLVNAKESHCPNCDQKLGNIQPSVTPKGESSDEISFQIG